jgi:acyl carrier protein
MNRSLTPDEIRATVLRLLGEIAPEADLTALKSDINFRDQLDIDSMDFLKFVISIHKAFGVEIPETDYPKYGTLDGCVDQLSGHCAK